MADDHTGRWDDTTAQAKMLEAEKRTRQFLDLMDRFDQLTWSEVVDIITVGIWDPDTRRTRLAEVREQRSNGASRPADIQNLEFHIREEVMDSFHIADKSAGLTGVGSMVFDRQVGLPPWTIYNPDILVANYGEGGFGRISGVPGTGKTNLGCVLMEEWERPSRVAISNVLPEEESDRYIYTETAKDFLLALTDLKPRQKWLLVLDEGGLVYQRQDQTTRRVKDLDKLMRVIRKLHGNMVLVEQRRDAVPALFEEFATSLYTTHAPGVVTIDLRGPNLRTRVKVRDFPKTSLPFDTYDIAYFSVNVNLQEVLELVTARGDRMDRLQEYLRDPEAFRADSKEKARSPTKAERIRRLLQEGEDDYAIAGTLRTDVAYVQRIRKAVESSERDDGSA